MGHPAKVLSSRAWRSSGYSQAPSLRVHPTRDDRRRISWDGEEYGLVGSTEFGEDFAD